MNNSTKNEHEKLAELHELAKMYTIMPNEISVLRSRSEIPPIIKELEKKLNALAVSKSLLLPNLETSNETIAIFSDYGGETKKSHYRVFSFLICAYNALGVFKDVQKQLREQYKLNDPFKEFSFKTLGYGPMDSALPEYLLNINNLVPGVVISVVVEKGNFCLWGSNKKMAQKEMVKLLKDNGFGEWKGEVAEKLATVVHLVSYFVALFAKDGQKIFWQSDNDAIMANDEKKANAGRLLASVLGRYTSAKFETIGYATSFDRNIDSAMFLDLLSLPDLVAGSIEHYLTRQRGMKEELTVKDGANELLVWHSYQGVVLKKYAFIFRAGETMDQMLAGTLMFKSIEAPSNVYFVDIDKNVLKSETRTKNDKSPTELSRTLEPL